MVAAFEPMWSTQVMTNSETLMQVGNVCDRTYLNLQMQCLQTLVQESASETLDVSPPWDSGQV